MSLKPLVHRFAALLLALPMLLATAPARAQSVPAPLPVPNITLSPGGFLWAAARQPDGGIVFSGYFTSVNGLPRGHIARLLPNGTLDPNWNPAANGVVTTLAVDSSGAVFAGGVFDVIGGRGRNSVGKLAGNGSGAADASWNAALLTPGGGGVNALALDGNGALYLGGAFTSAGGVTRNFIAKVSSSGTGAVDATWNPSAFNVVRTLALDGAGSVYAGGGFATIGGQARNFIAKLSVSGTGAADANWNPSADGPVVALALDGSGAVYAAGFFTSIGGQPRSRIAKLAASGTGAANVSWNPSPNGNVIALLVDGTSVYVGGAFTHIGGQPRTRIARLASSGTGAADTVWNPSADNDVHGLALGSGGSVYVAGMFDLIGGETRANFAALPANVIWRTLTYSAAANGTISGISSQTVADGGSGTAVTAVSNAGYDFVQWSDGSTVNPRIDTNVTANLSVSASFVSNAPNLSLTIDAGRDHVRYGQTLSYAITLSNSGIGMAQSTSIRLALPPQIDANAATWTCTNGGAGALCTPSGDGPLQDDAVALAPGRSLTWLVNAPVRSDATGGDIVTTVTASAGTVSANASDSVVLVLMRNGFEAPGNGLLAWGMVRSCTPDAESVVPDEGFARHFRLPPAAALFETVLAVRGEDGSGLRIERANLGSGAWLQWIAIDTDGRESAGAWSVVHAGAELTLTVAAAADGTRHWRLDGAAEPLTTPLSASWRGTVRIHGPDQPDGECN